MPQSAPQPNPKNEENKRKEASLKATVDAYIAELEQWKKLDGRYPDAADAANEEEGEGEGEVRGAAAGQMTRVCAPVQQLAPNEL
jgi:hypothetical protein